MKDEQDAGSAGKKTIALAGMGVMVLAGFGYLASTWFKTDTTMVSRVNLNSTTAGGGYSAVETPRYRELLAADNARSAEEARRSNESFIASLPQGLDVAEDTVEAPVTEPGLPPADDRRRAPEKSEDPAVGEKRAAALQKLIARIHARHPEGSAPVAAVAMWQGPGGTAPSPARPGVESAGLSAAPRPAGRPGVQLIPALTRVPAFIDTAINSDNPDSKVTASIPSGPYAGAVLFSSAVKLAGNGVEVHFTRMSWRGMNLRVNAYAQNEENLMSSVATDVNHRWFSHIVLPSVLGGAAGVGTLYKDANTQIVQGSYGSVTGRVGMPDGEAVAGVIAGGTAERAGEVLSQQLAQTPYKQVTVSPKEVISILFVDPVMSDDVDTASASGLAPAGNAGDRTARPAADVAGQTNERLQAAIERRRAEMRQKYGD